MQILVVDDHTLFREALGGVLARLDANLTVLEAATAREARDIVAHYRNLDLVLLDHGMPGLNGVDAIPLLQACSPGTPIVVLSASEDEQVVHAAVGAGAAGFVPKSADSHTLLAALRVVLAGEVYLPPRYLADAPPCASSPTGLSGRLTQRQREVLSLLAGGLSNKAIARDLGITEATVKLHVSAILRELGARNRTEAVVTAGDRGLLAG